jgi:23S rRNA (cytosine1962-C5)-methyltransferase
MNSISRLRLLRLKKSSSEALGRFHPWIFSGALIQESEMPAEGEWVQLADVSGKRRAVGYYSKGSIAVRIVGFDEAQTIEELLERRLKSAVELRRMLRFPGPASDGFRLFNAEGDGIPGLIVDIYRNCMVFQAHSRTVWSMRKLICEKLIMLMPELQIASIYDKSEAPQVAAQGADRQLKGTTAPVDIHEYGLKLRVSPEEGQKTGTFLDQRENRKLLASFAEGKRVLNAFCYSGGFSLSALLAGASKVHSVDLSAKAIEWTRANVELNFGSDAPHEAFRADVFEFLKQSESYSLMVLDPPAFSKGLKTRHQGIQAYRRLNALGFEKLSPGGILFTFSCSQSVSPDLFEGAIRAAAIDSGRSIRILHRLQQPADHPVSIFHPEGHYLKGFVLQAE